MKQIIVLVLIAAALTACNKRKNWRYFNADGLVFVSYEKNDRLKFRDTFAYTHSLQQSSFARDFRFISGNPIYGGVGPKYEKYLADYGYHSLEFEVQVDDRDHYRVKMDNYH